MDTNISSILGMAGGREGAKDSSAKPKRESRGRTKGRGASVVRPRKRKRKNKGDEGSWQEEIRVAGCSVAQADAGLAFNSNARRERLRQYGPLSDCVLSDFERGSSTGGGGEATSLNSDSPSTRRQSGGELYYEGGECGHDGPCGEDGLWHTCVAPGPHLYLDSRQAIPVQKVEPTECTNKEKIYRLVRRCTRFLAADRGLPLPSKIPEDTPCGGLRSALRGLYGKSLTIADELSIKTSQKLEPQPCVFCRPAEEEYMAAWERKVGRDQPVDGMKLKFFKETLRMNVDRAWNVGEFVRVPNGHGSLHHTRREGGNWNEEEFDESCRIELVHSSGKPRVVTLYSEYNQKILHPLHRALYRSLSKYSWLLLGPPTDEIVGSLLGGDWLSFDYSSATDSIKSQYVRAMVDVLIEKSVGLNEEQIKCMRVLERMKLGDGWSHTGQPMGSLMSFPMLCLFNKTLVDMALADSLGMLSRRRIHRDDLMVYQTHRCKINGDDLLTRVPPRQKKDFVACMAVWGREIGLIVNEEKTMRSSVFAEINSTVFRNAQEDKKTNLKVLGVGRRNVGDALELAEGSTVSESGVKYALEALQPAFSVQKDKKVRKHPRLVAFLRGNKRLRAASTAVPNEEEKEKNLFPVVDRPDNYDLLPCEERRIVEREVNRLRPVALAWKEDEKKGPARKVKWTFADSRSFSAVVRQRGRRSQETILECLDRAFRQDRLELVDNSWIETPDPLSFPEDETKENSGRCVRLLEALKAFRLDRQQHRPVGAVTPV